MDPENHLRKSELAIALLLTVAILALQAWHGNAFHAEFTGSGDEAAHYVTGLMVHDYLRAGAPWPPLPYAQSYYEHYPKVALGHWPPVYFLAQAAWTLFFGPGRTSVLLLQIAVAGLFLTMCFALLRRWFAAWAVWPVCFLAATTHGVAILSRTVGSEILVAALVLASVLALERFLLNLKLKAALWSAAFAVAAVLTKGTGVMLAPIAAVAVIAYACWRQLRRLEVAIVLALAVAIPAPWFLLVPGAMHERVMKYGGFGGFQTREIFRSFEYWLDQFGWIGLALIALGLFGWLIRRKQLGPRPFWIVALSAPLIMGALRFSMPVWEPRHLIASLPFLLIFLCMGSVELAHRLGGSPRARAAVVLLLTGLGMHSALRIEPKHRLGLDAVATAGAAAPGDRKQFLILSDSLGEGVFISELAMREARPGSRIHRGGKLLVRSDMLGTSVRPNYANRSELLALLPPPGVTLVLDQPRTEPDYLRDARNALQSSPDNWRIVAEYPRYGSPESRRRIQVWRRTEDDQRITAAQPPFAGNSNTSEPFAGTANSFTGPSQ